MRSSRSTAYVLLLMVPLLLLSTTTRTEAEVYPPRLTFYVQVRGKGKKQRLASTTSNLPTVVNVMSQQPISMDVKNNKNKIHLQQQRFRPAQALTQRWSKTSSFFSQRTSSLMTAVREHIPRPDQPDWTVPRWNVTRQKVNCPIEQKERLKSWRAKAVSWQPSLREWMSNARNYIHKKKDDEDKSYVLGYYIFSFAVGLTFDMLF
ncbi:hypothetical protein FisN_29Lh017 [Fistulifera solaris]|uniref:Uncharacterized protein n=1 Tax=Fistulifera solaris TaxID=1519565 RepID=A0A1Z5JLC2_FISSO|nr:hypothetical protein FisN_29Lh017 [Fistulifera solaris]|eukprot:GAX14813.1 hypothetical protein FisN_29Lh017 [Fistulifera solaris]